MKIDAREFLLRASLCTLAIFPMLGPATVFAGTTTLTTYYPAPNGFYGKMTLVPNTTQAGQCNTGAMYVDNTSGELKYCVDDNTNNPSPDPHTGLPPLSPPFTSTANTGTWGNMIAKTPVIGDPPNAVATKAYVDAAANSGMPGLGMDPLNTYFAQQGFFTPHSNTCSGGDAFVPIFSGASVGNCIETGERPAATWVVARQTCAAAGKRLLEPGEWQAACGSAFGVPASWEWSSNFALPMYNGGNYGVGAAGAGAGNCANASIGWVGRYSGGQSSTAFRCVR